MIRLSGISRSYTVGGETVHALVDVSETIEAAEYLAIMGPSGSGKSTLLHVLGCLDRPDQGRYELDLPKAVAGAHAMVPLRTAIDDGTTQVTYAGRPLYYYVDDPPGEILCHNVEEFGGLWLVVEPGGEAVG